MRPGGASKGCAYVDFSDDAAVTDALTHDRELWHGKNIEVARSAPPDRKGGKRGGRGGGRGGGGGRGRGRGAEAAPAAAQHARLAVTDMMPRAVAKKKAAGAPLSNDDFRKLLGS